MVWVKSIFFFVLCNNFYFIIFKCHLLKFGLPIGFTYFVKKQLLFKISIMFSKYILFHIHTLLATTCSTISRCTKEQTGTMMLSLTQIKIGFILAIQKKFRWFKNVKEDQFLWFSSKCLGHFFKCWLSQYLAVKSRDSGARLPRFTCSFLHLFLVWPWKNLLNFFLYT